MARLTQANAVQLVANQLAHGRTSIQGIAYATSLSEDTVVDALRVLFDRSQDALKTRKGA